MKWIRLPKYLRSLIVFAWLLTGLIACKTEKPIEIVDTPGYEKIIETKNLNPDNTQSDGIANVQIYEVPDVSAHSYALPNDPTAVESDVKLRLWDRRPRRFVYAEVHSVDP